MQLKKNFLVCVVHVAIQLMVSFFFLSQSNKLIQKGDELSVLVGNLKNKTKQKH